jgi:hypothetical protein
MSQQQAFFATTGQILGQVASAHANMGGSHVEIVTDTKEGLEARRAQSSQAPSPLHPLILADRGRVLLRARKDIAPLTTFASEMSTAVVLGEPNRRRACIALTYQMFVRVVQVGIQNERDKPSEEAPTSKTGKKSKRRLPGASRVSKRQRKGSSTLGRPNPREMLDDEFYNPIGFLDALGLQQMESWKSLEDRAQGQSSGKADEYRDSSDAAHTLGKSPMGKVSAGPLSPAAKEEERLIAKAIEDLSKVKLWFFDAGRKREYRLCNLDVDREEFMHCLESVSAYVFPIESVLHLAVDGWMVPQLFAAINHSCRPNAYIYVRQGMQNGPDQVYSLELVSLEAIPKGTEITVSYEPRSMWLSRPPTRGFGCQCNRCPPAPVGFVDPALQTLLREYEASQRSVFKTEAMLDALFQAVVTATEWTDRSNELMGYLGSVALTAACHAPLKDSESTVTVPSSSSSSAASSASLSSVPAPPSSAPLPGPSSGLSGVAESSSVVSEPTRSTMELLPLPPTPVSSPHASALASTSSMSLVSSNELNNPGNTNEAKEILDGAVSPLLLPPPVVPVDASSATRSASFVSVASRLPDPEQTVIKACRYLLHLFLEHPLTQPRLASILEGEQGALLKAAWQTILFVVLGRVFFVADALASVHALPSALELYSNAETHAKIEPLERVYSSVGDALEALLGLGPTCLLRRGGLPVATLSKRFTASMFSTYFVFTSDNVRQPEINDLSITFGTWMAYADSMQQAMSKVNLQTPAALPAPEASPDASMSQH